MLTIRRLTLALATVCVSASAMANEGKAIYDQFCAACHNNPAETRAVSLENLKTMSAQSIRFALTEGVMQAQGSMVPAGKLDTLIDYLAASSEEGDWVAGMMCPENARTVNLDQTAALSSFGVDLENTRYLDAKQAGLKSKDLKKLELAWAVGIPGANLLRGTAPIVGNTMFYGAGSSNMVLALDTETGCAKWAYDAGAPISNSLVYGELGEGGKKAVVFAVGRGLVHAVDAQTGEKIWETNAAHQPRAGITGAPLLYKDRVIVPLSNSGVGTGANPRYECCEEHGAVAALNAKTGEKLWTYHTMEEAKYTGEVNSLGVKLRGPSGAPIWASPSIDVKRGLVYAASGQNTSLPATETSNAIIAIDLASGEQKWVFQALPNDVWHMGCRVPWEKSSPNCPSPEKSILKDFDFGSAPVITKTSKGKDIIVAGQKSGDVWGVNPDNGEVIWNQRIGQGSVLGGNHWGVAVDGKRVFVPINDPAVASNEDDWEPIPSMNALDISTGELLWQTPMEADCSNGRKDRYPLCEHRYGLSATPLAIDKSVIAASIDGRLFVFDSKNGKVVWEFDTLRDFDTVNGVEGKGGSIDSHSIFAGNGMVFVSSGYNRFSQPPGNVLLAFRPKK